MASLGLLLLSVTLIHAGQSLPAAHAEGRGLDLVGGARRQRRELRNLLPYDHLGMSHPAAQVEGEVNDLYYQSDDWRGRGLDQVLQRLVERDQKREQEEQRAAYVAVLLRLLSETDSTGLVGPGDVEVVEEEDDQGPLRDFQGPAPPDYDETGWGMSMGRPPATWWGLMEPQLVQAMMDRTEPQSLLSRARLAGRVSSGPSTDPETLRRLVARILSSISPNNAPVISSGHRVRRDLSVKEPEPVSSSHRRARRSLDDMALPSPSNNPPLLRVKRLEVNEKEEQEEEKIRPHAAGLQRMKRINTMAIDDVEELNHGSRRRRRRAALNYDPQILIAHLLEYMRE